MKLHCRNIVFLESNLINVVLNRKLKTFSDLIIKNLDKYIIKLIVELN